MRTLRQAPAWCLVVLASLLPHLAQAQPPHTTPGYPDAICLEPYGPHLGLVGSGFINRAQQQGYLVLERRRATWNDPVVTISQVDNALYLGYGIWWNNSHGSISGLAIEAYPLTTQGLVARNNAMVSYASAGWDTLNDIYASSSAGGYHISISATYIAYRFYSWRSIVFNGSCDGHQYANNWTNALCVLGYLSGTCPSDVRSDSDQLFGRMNGEQGTSLRTVDAARNGTGLSRYGNGDAVLSPMVTYQNVGTPLDARRIAVVQFDCAMDQTVLGNQIVQGSGAIETAYVGWTAGQTNELNFTMIGRSVGSGTVYVNAADPEYDVIGAKSDGGIPMDGWGVGPNRDDEWYSASSNYQDDQPAAEVSGFAVVQNGGLTAQWFSGPEHGTAKFLVEHGSDWNGPFVVVAEVPAANANQYVVPVNASADGVFRLREVETDGDTLVLALDTVSQPFTVPSVTITITDQDRERISKLLSDHARATPLSPGPPVYAIFAPRAFLAAALELANYHTEYRGISTEVVILEDIGGAAGIHSHLIAHPNIRYYLKYGDASDNVDLNGQVWWMNDAMWNVNGFGPRPNWPLQPQNNLIPMRFVEELEPQPTSLSYWVKWRGIDLFDGDRNEDGILGDGDAFGARAPVSDTVEAHAFNYKTMEAAYQGPATNVSFWSYAHDVFGNLGSEVLKILGLLRNEFSDWHYFWYLYDTPQNPLTANQRDAMSKQGLENTQGWTIVSSASFQRYHVGGFQQKTNGYDPRTITYTGRSNVILGACGIGDIDRTENQSIGTPITEDLVLLLNSPVWFMAGPNKGSRTMGNYPIIREIIRQWRADSSIAIGELVGRALGTVKQQNPAYATLCDEWEAIGDPTLTVPPPMPPVVGVGDGPVQPTLLISPNPARQALSVSFWMPTAQPANLTIHDVQGRLVASLADGRQTAGLHQFQWNGHHADGQSIGPGIYFVRFRTGQTTEQRKIVWLH